MKVADWTDYAAIFSVELVEVKCGVAFLWPCHSLPVYLLM